MLKKEGTINIKVSEKKELKNPNDANRRVSHMDELTAQIMLRN